MRAAVFGFCLATSPALACAGEEMPVWLHAANTLGVIKMSAGVAPSLDPQDEVSRTAIWQSGERALNWLAHRVETGNPTQTEALAYVLLDETFKCLAADYPTGSHIPYAERIAASYPEEIRANLREIAREHLN